VNIVTTLTLCSLSTVLDAVSNVSCNFYESLACGYTLGNCWKRLTAYETHGEPADVSIIAYLLCQFSTGRDIFRASIVA